MIILTRSRTRELLGSLDLVALQRQAFLALEDDPGLLAARVLLNSGSEATVFSYVAAGSAVGPVVAKLGSVHPPVAGESVNAYLSVLDPATGELLALLDGEAVTTARTPAASVVAVGALRPDPARIAIVGTGVQGRAHAEWLGKAFPAAELRLWSRSAPREELETWSTGLGLELTVPADRAAALADADVIVTATTAFSPVLTGAEVAPGALVVSVGSFAPQRVELDPTVMARAAAVVVDHVPTASAQSGPLVAGLRDGLVRPEQVRSLGSVLAADTGIVEPEPDDNRDLTVYLSVGLGIQDAVVAAELIDPARTGLLPQVDLRS